MIILIEGHQYPGIVVDKYLKGVSNLRDVDGLVSVNYVGYFYNPHPDVKDCVFILPKVLLDYNVDEKSETVFGRLKPEEIIDPEAKDANGKMLLSTDERSFIYELSVWIYRAIVVFNEQNPQNQIVLRQNVQQMSRGRLRQCSTYLDIILALLKFSRDNQDFFFFTLRNIHSGQNKINWTRTIAHSNCFIQDETPVYLNPVNKKRQINFDEELIVIFLSILQYVSKQYGFPFRNEFGYQLITGNKFEHLLKKSDSSNCPGCRRLIQIKYKYFSDKALLMWDLCYAFFDRSSHINVQTDMMEYLLVKDFNIVFEAIIDELVGDRFVGTSDPAMKQLDKLKNQPDGKIVDHLYRYDSMIHTGDEDKVWYIGDSKYYKRSTPIGENSEFKQFTYARNVIQWSINVFLDTKEWPGGVALRDKSTEGYNVIPNFFISAEQKKLKSDRAIVPHVEGDRIRNRRHFENRLFDRDTLLVCHYDVNFLFVVALYAQNNSGEKKRWRDYVRLEFMKAIRIELEHKYQFYAMTARTDDNGQYYIDTHFQKVAGKLFKPYGDNRYFSLALDRNDPEKDNDALKMELEKHFFITKEISLGENPAIMLEEQVENAGGRIHVERKGQSDEGVLMVMMENYAVKSPNFIPQEQIAIGLKLTKDSMEIASHLSDISFVLFHTRSDSGQHRFRITGQVEIVQKSELPIDSYCNIDTTDLYALVRFEKDDLDCSKLHSGKKKYSKTTRYDAQFCFMSELMD